MTDFTAKPADGCAWITGASTGIGASLALKLAKEGWTVAATARNGEKLQALSDKASNAKGRILPFPGDITDKAGVSALVEKIEQACGPVALCVLNAGVYLPVHARDLDVEAIEKSFDVNVLGTTYCLAPVMQRMIERRRGQIAIVSSVTGYGGLPTSAAYGATKSALITMAESLKFDLDHYGVRIQVINPGFVDTPATAENPFPMPALVSSDVAAKRIATGLKRKGFEITFPKRFTYVLKALGLLPRSWRLALVARATRWSEHVR